MARKPAKLDPPPLPDKSVTEEAKSRLKEARDQKEQAILDLQEAYFFVRTRLCWHVRSNTPPTQRRNQDNDEDLAIGLGPEVSEDFATEMVAAFFPQGTRWVEASVDKRELAELEAAEKEDVLTAVKERDEVIFSTIWGSNFDAELGVALDPDAAIGTIGLWIDKPVNTRPISAAHVPTSELEINVGPDGLVDDRFRVRWVKASKLRAVIGSDVSLPEKIERKITGSPGARVEVVWGFWRDWSEPEDDRWTHVLMVDGVAVHKATLTGEGSLPLIVMRFSPDSQYAWGYGPAIKALQEFRVLDCIMAATQDRVDIAVSPPFGYPDDGVVNLEGGIEAGKAYPMRMGSGRDVVPLYFEGDANLGMYQATDLERRIKRKFFADYPEQKGDTPPTATQWTDEMVRAQRRIGTPGKKFWREGPYEVYRRYEFLLAKDGKIADVEAGGVKLTLTPNNPATQAQDNQKLQTGTQVLTAAKNLFPMTSQAAIDEYETIENMKKLSRDEMIVLRNKGEVDQLVQAVLGAAQQGQGGGGGQTQ